MVVGTRPSSCARSRSCAAPMTSAARLLRFLPSDPAMDLYSVARIRYPVVQDEQVPGLRDAMVPGCGGSSVCAAGVPGQPEILELFDDEPVHTGQMSSTRDCCSCTALGPTGRLGELLLSQFGRDPEVNGVRDAFPVSCVHGGDSQGREQFPGSDVRALPIMEAERGCELGGGFSRDLIGGWDVHRAQHSGLESQGPAAHPDAVRRDLLPDGPRPASRWALT